MKRQHIIFLLVAPLLAPLAVARADDELVVYPPVPGLAASEHYTVRVRSARDGSQWQSAFAWETVCKTIEKKTDAYFDTLAGWTHTYVNFETAGAVEIEIARVNGQPICAATVHPKRKASACSVKDGKVLVRLDKPCLVA
ncbi:MAG: endo-polygalacturonase, partial [Planctomycetota bacterium]|nr:endo-polygalacturonase [Planctomycetota bacterium]